MNSCTNNVVHPPCQLPQGHVGPHNWDLRAAEPYPSPLVKVLERIAIELEIANLYRAADRSHSTDDEQALKAAIGRRRQLRGPIDGRRT